MMTLIVISIILISLANAIAVFIGGIAAIRGDGGEQYGIWTVWTVGGVWVAATTAFSLYQCYKGEELFGLAIVAAAIFAPVFILSNTILIFTISTLFFTKLRRIIIMSASKKKL